MMIAGLLKDIAQVEARLGVATGQLTKFLEEMEKVAILQQRPDLAIAMIDEMQVRKYELLALHSRLLDLHTREALERARAREGAAVKAARDEEDMEP